jgi:NAD(P)-dependent dehydrogenase (short-subunit alcohol dehydrogenase family)
MGFDMLNQAETDRNDTGRRTSGVPARTEHTDQSGVRMVVGGNRGIGLALVKAQLAMPEVERVIATYRPTSGPGELASLARAFGQRLQPHPLDVAHDGSIEQFANFLAGQSGGIDLTIHAAGMLHGDSIQPEKSLEQCDSASLRRLFEVNSIGPLMVAGALLPAHRRNRRFTFAALSAMVGSIEDNRLGGWYGYRASKAALNQFVKTLSNECRIKFPRASIVAIHPGTTDTDLSRPFQRNVREGKLYSPEQTATRILSVLEGLEANQSGLFLNWDGSTIPW